MIFIPGRIPVTIHFLFWIMAGVIGWIASQSFLGTLIWIGIVFFSVLFHEFGHALTATAFGQKARIQLIVLGGLTSYEGPAMKFWQQFLIVLNGPLASLLICAVATLLLTFNVFQSDLAKGILLATQWANLFWSVINLLPVLPLDGGQLLRIALEGIFGIRGFKASLFIGGAIATLLGLGFFLLGSFLAGALFLLFAYQSFDGWRRMKHATKLDRDEGARRLLEEGEKALQEGRIGDAKSCFEELRKIGREGVLYAASSEYLAYLEAQEGKKQQAFDLLSPVKEDLTEEGLCLLHQLASDLQQDQWVADLSTLCYQKMQTQEVALKNARAFARLHQAKLAGGWLTTAWQHGGLDLQALLNEESFQSLKNDPEFRYFVDSLT